MPSTDYFTYGYAAMVASGGLIGFAKAGSIPSLSAGLLFGALLSYGAYQTSQDPRNYYLALGTSTVLAGIMGKKFLKGGKFMPAGLIATVSLMMVARFGSRALGLVETNQANE